jgi:poly-gamma-glutamate synthesis protein (capsule biosynthesis protein)
MRFRLLIGAVLLLVACKPDREVSVIFGGDVMLDRGIRAGINVKGLKHFTDNLTPVFKNADYTVINLECPATHIRASLTKKFIFRAEPSWLPGLKEAGVTHCIVANNHTYDQGRAGLMSTVRNLHKAGLGVAGYGQTQQEACAPVVLEKNGIAIALFSSVTLPLESWVYLEDSPGMCQATIENLEAAIAAYRVAHPQTYIIVSLHWGIEYQKMPTALQRAQAKALVAAGADAIIGHHPHVVQTYEQVDGKPVFYSVGNLIFDNPNPLTHDGILVKLTIGEDESNVQVIPYRTDEGKPVLGKPIQPW